MFLHAESTYLREGDKVAKGIENRGMINRRWRNIWWQKKKKNWTGVEALLRFVARQWHGTDTRIDRDATDSSRISIRHGYDSSDEEKSWKHATQAKPSIFVSVCLI